MIYVCDVTLSVSTLGKLKSQLDRSWNRTHDLWFASPILYQLSYKVESVRVCDISKLNLVLRDISMFLNYLKLLII